MRRRGLVSDMHHCLILDLLGCRRCRLVKNPTTRPLFWLHLCNSCVLNIDPEGSSLASEYAPGSSGDHRRQSF